jgi:hypothetical protein
VLPLNTTDRGTVHMRAKLRHMRTAVGYWDETYVSDSNANIRRNMFHG